MTEESHAMTILTGGCQCGAIRFACDGSRAGTASICHCRMCQKATGQYFAALVPFPHGAVTWTRGTRKLYRSSNHVSRGFCAECGTPLTYEVDGAAPSIACGAFDDAAAIRPLVQDGVESELPFVAGLAALPRVTTEASAAEYPILADVVSYQHPDHDTAVWPLPKA
jgi:hypothetical protein